MLYRLLRGADLFLFVILSVFCGCGDESRIPSGAWISASRTTQVSPNWGLSVCFPSSSISTTTPPYQCFFFSRLHNEVLSGILGPTGKTAAGSSSAENLRGFVRAVRAAGTGGDRRWLTVQFASARVSRRYTEITHKERRLKALVREDSSLCNSFFPNLPLGLVTVISGH